MGIVSPIKIRSRRRTWMLAALLVAIFVALVLLSDARMSQTFDEGFHLVAGYRYVQCADFGINAEHPPLVKMVVGLALRMTHTPAPQGACGTEPTTKDYGYALGVDYLYHKGLDAQRVLMRARAATIVFAILLLSVIFLLARDLFGDAAALLALLLAITEPTLIAHAALVTTDMAVSAGVLLAVYLLYRFLRKPSPSTLLLAGVAVGLGLSVKHSGVIIVPIVIALEIADLLLRRTDGPLRDRILAKAATLAAMFFVAVLVLWATYGFRYWPRPDHAPMSRSLADFLVQVRAQGTRGVMIDFLIPLAARLHLLPLAYLYGLVDVLNVSHPGLPPFILGRLLPHGVWYYFPVAFLIKSTPAFLILLVISLLGGGWLSHERRRAAVFLLVPVIIWYCIAMTSGLDIGYRHVLPTIAFLAIFIAGGIVHFVRTRDSRAAKTTVIVLVSLHVASAAFAFPNYFSYGDELLGGEENVYRYLTDSNNDWGQGLLATSRWLKARGITDCWIAYDGAADLKYYGIPCRALPGNPGDAQPLPPAEATGLFIISGLSYAGVEWEPGKLHPYADFHNAKPIDNIGGAMLVYRGTFDLRAVQSVALLIRASNSMAAHPDKALEDADAALALTPTSVRGLLIKARALEALGRRDDAHNIYASALQRAHSTGDDWYPFQLAEANEGLARTHGSSNTVTPPETPLQQSS